ncbi:MAG: hypothetical protein ABMA25_01310 [Ilumatobacteraceae bacterium]
MEVYSSGRGLVVSGSTSDVTAFIDQMVAITRESGGRSRHMVVNSLQVGANALAYRQTHREYFEFSARALKLLKEHGAIATDDGFFRSFVRKGAHFAGNLDWKKVDLSPEQALSMQAAAGQMALKAAIKEVTAAIERVEGKVDQLVRSAQAERLGSVLGDRATLHPLAERVRATGEISATDWSTVSTLGSQIARDIETLRAYVMKRLDAVESGSFVRSRADEAEELAEDLMRESIALLVVAEQNYVLWQELRLANGLNRERSAVANLTHDIQAQLTALAAVDQRLVDRLAEVIRQLTEPTGFEGLAPLGKRKLLGHAAELEKVAAWFVDQRHLDLVASEAVSYPSLAESLGKVGDHVAAAARSTTKLLASGMRRRAEESHHDGEDPKASSGMKPAGEFPHEEEMG